LVNKWDNYEFCGHGKIDLYSSEMRFYDRRKIKYDGYWGYTYRVLAQLCLLFSLDLQPKHKMIISALNNHLHTKTSFQLPTYLIRLLLGFGLSSFFSSSFFFLMWVRNLHQIYKVYRLLKSICKWRNTGELTKFYVSFYVPSTPSIVKRGENHVFYTFPRFCVLWSDDIWDFKNRCILE